MPRIFISYRRDDSSYAALHLYERLASRFGRDNVFFDVDAIPFGIDFRRHLSDAVGRCDVLLAVIGDGWLTATNADGHRRLDDPADFVRIEIQTALERGIPVIPVLVGRASMPREHDLPVGLKDLAYRNAAELRSGRDFNDHADRLVRGLEYLDRQAQAPIEPASPPRPVREEAVRAEVQPVRCLADSVAGQIRRFALAPGLDMDFAYLPAGTFRMGSPKTEAGRFKDEVLHPVTLTKPFYLGIYPVTVGEFEHFAMATKYQTQAEKEQDSTTWRTPGFAQTARHPVVHVSWKDALALVTWLNQTRDDSGLVYALPTEAQWEYACRAESNTAYFWGNDVARLDEHAWFSGNAGRETRPVETKKANPWGLWHAHGLVWEWCADWYGPYPSAAVQNPSGPAHGSSRVIRGGSWSHAAEGCRAANRSRFTPADTDRSIGLRLARVLAG